MLQNLMLERRIATNGVVYYASPLLEQLGVRHAFSTRVAHINGGSPPPFDTFNLGNPIGCAVQDNYPRILHHYRLLQEACGCPVGEYCRMHQVHGPTVHRVQPGIHFDKATQGDGIVSSDPTRSVAVRVADCTPILMASDDGQTVAAVHAGWRGVVAGVAVAALREMNVEPSSVVAAIGPCIGFESFEVGAEVLEEFVKTFGPEAPIRRRNDGKGNVDLRECLKRQLLGAGVAPDRLDTTDRCTFRDRDEFYSHRRDQGVTGRMAAIIAPRG